MLLRVWFLLFHTIFCFFINFCCKASTILFIIFIFFYHLVLVHSSGLLFFWLELDFRSLEWKNGAENVQNFRPGNLCIIAGLIHLKEKHLCLSVMMQILIFKKKEDIFQSILHVGSFKWSITSILCMVKSICDMGKQNNLQQFCRSCQAC